LTQTLHICGYESLESRYSMRKYKTSHKGESTHSADKAYKKNTVKSFNGGLFR